MAWVYVNAASGPLFGVTTNVTQVMDLRQVSAKLKADAIKACQAGITPSMGLVPEFIQVLSAYLGHTQRPLRLIMQRYQNMATLSGWGSESTKLVEPLAQDLINLSEVRWQMGEASGRIKKKRHFGQVSGVSWHSLELYSWRPTQRRGLTKQLQLIVDAVPDLRANMEEVIKLIKSNRKIKLQ